MYRCLERTKLLGALPPRKVVKKSLTVGRAVWISIFARLFVRRKNFVHSGVHAGIDTKDPNKS